MKSNMTLVGSKRTVRQPVFNAAPTIRQMLTLFSVLAISICATTSAFSQTLTVTPTTVCVGDTITVTLTNVCDDARWAESYLQRDVHVGTIDVPLTDNNDGSWSGTYTTVSDDVGTDTITADDDGDCDPADDFNSVSLTVVQLNDVTVDGAADTGDDDYDYATMKTTSSSDFVTTIADLTPLNATAATKLVWSAGTPSSDNLQTQIPKNVAAETELTASCCGTSVSVNIWVISAVLKSVEFTSDYCSNGGIIYNNTVDWTDTGITGAPSVPYPRFQKPDWVDGTTINNPILQTMDTEVRMKVVVNVQPANLPFNIYADDDGLYLSCSALDKSGSTSDQTIPMGGTSENLPTGVGIYSENVNWTISAFGGNFDCVSTASGAHTIYTTYGTPCGTAGQTGNYLTKNRLDYLCGLFDTSQYIHTDTDIVNTLGPISTGAGLFNEQYSIKNKMPYYTAWEIFGNILGESNGDCITESTLMEYELDMLGVSGSQAVYVCSCHNNWDHIINTGESDPNKGWLGYYNNGYVDSQGNLHGWNNYEACCSYGGQLWPGGFGEAYTDAKTVLYLVSSSDGTHTGQNTQYHQAYTSQANWGTIVRYPNP